MDEIRVNGWNDLTERVLFPGLDGLSRRLKPYYIPKSTAVRRAIEE